MSCFELFSAAMLKYVIVIQLGLMLAERCLSVLSGVVSANNLAMLIQYALYKEDVLLLNTGFVFRYYALNECQQRWSALLWVNLLHIVPG